jgi:hypothetical protein
MDTTDTENCARGLERGVIPGLEDVLVHSSRQALRYQSCSSTLAYLQ